MRRLTLALLIAASAACTREAGLFVENNARAHVEMLAGSIGSRPVGTAANLKARQYIIDQLRQIGFVVRVQETDARRHELGRTARVANIIGMLQGERTEALALVSHYDSSPDAPGATDAALGVAVSLEAARVFATTGQRRWSLFVLLTDGEESGLMGAAGLVTDRDVMDRLRAYINVESIGSAGTAVLFEAGPGNAWLVSPWARYAPHPRGGSYALEIYQRLPNDTDFSVLKTRDVPGLHFAAVGDSYAYHTARDTPDRLTRETIRNTGENIVAVVHALQRVDITARAAPGATFFDVGGTVAVTYGPVWHWLIAVTALLLGVFAWVRLTADAIRHNGMLRWLLTVVWGWLGAALVCGSFVAATWLLRTAREVYHPWYAHPTRLFLLMLLMGVTVGWGMARAGQWLPGRAHPARHPALAWSVALPAWIGVALLALWFAPSAAYLWLLPLLAAGVLLAVIPPHADTAIRAASFLVLAVAGTLWVRDTYELLQFVVTVMGRLPVVTPVYVYAALLGAASAMVAPPLVAMLVVTRPLGRPWLVTALLLLATVAAAGSAYGLAPVGLKALSSLRMEKAYRDYGHDIDNTDCPLEAGLGFALALDKPGGFIGRDALLARKARNAEVGGMPRRIVQVRLLDPEPLMYHAEVVLRDGVEVGYVRAASYGWTLGAAVGLAQVSNGGEPVTAEWLSSGRWEVDVAGHRYDAEVSLRPMYDPTSARDKV
jgi:hypothetical protein